MPFFRGGTLCVLDLYSFNVKVETASSSWAQWPLCLPQSSDRRWGAFIVSVSTRRHRARFFLSLWRLIWRVSTQKDKKRGTCGLIIVERASYLCLWNCTICFFLDVWVRLVIYFYCLFVCMIHRFALISAFSCAVCISCIFIFLICCFERQISK